MEIITKTDGQVANLKVIGRVDTTNYNEFENTVKEVIVKDIKYLNMDCSELVYISSSGLRVFLTVQKFMSSNGGKFSLHSLQPGIKEIFDISGFSQIFNIFNNPEDIRNE